MDAGTLCGACVEGWGLTNVATCMKCPSKALNTTYFALVSVFTLVVLILAIFAALEAQRQAHLPAMHPSQEQHAMALGAAALPPSIVARINSFAGSVGRANSHTLRDGSILVPSALSVARRGSTTHSKSNLAPRGSVTAGAPSRRSSVESRPGLPGPASAQVWPTASPWCCEPEPGPSDCACLRMRARQGH
jgi:hypothetical protein